MQGENKLSVLIRLIVVIIISVMASLIFYLCSQDIVSQLVNQGKINLTNLISVSTSISAIIFAISGAWVALIFPKALEKLKTNDKTKK